MQKESIITENDEIYEINSIQVQQHWIKVNENN